MKALHLFSLFLMFFSDVIASVDLTRPIKRISNISYVSEMLDRITLETLVVFDLDGVISAKVAGKRTIIDKTNLETVLTKLNEHGAKLLVVTSSPLYIPKTKSTMDIKRELIGDLLHFFEDSWKEIPIDDGEIEWPHISSEKGEFSPQYFSGIILTYYNDASKEQNTLKGPVLMTFLNYLAKHHGIRFKDVLAIDDDPNCLSSMQKSCQKNEFEFSSYLYRHSSIYPSKPSSVVSHFDTEDYEPSAAELLGLDLGGDVWLDGYF